MHRKKTVQNVDATHEKSTAQKLQLLVQWYPKILTHYGLEGVRLVGRSENGLVLDIWGGGGGSHELDVSCMNDEVVKRLYT